MSSTWFNNLMRSVLQNLIALKLLGKETKQVKTLGFADTATL